MAISVPLASADELRHKQHQAKVQITRAQSNLDDSSHALVAAAGRLQQATHQLDAAEKNLVGTAAQLVAARLADTQMAAELQQAQRELYDARQAVVRGRENIVEQRATIGRLAADSFSNGTPALMGLSVMLTARTPNEVTSQINDVDIVMAQQDNALSRLTALKAVLVTQQRKRVRDEAAVASARKAAAANLVRKNALERQATQEGRRVAALVASRRTAERGARRVQAAARSQLRKAQADNLRIKKLILERARREHGGYRGATNGFLGRPVNGPVTSPFGFRFHPIFGTWGLHDGTDFAAGCGLPLLAVADGTVVQEYPQVAWGNRLLIDLGNVNGKNLSVIYNHLSGYRVATGARVHRGEVVGYVGTTGWSTGCHLHFTVLVNAIPVDPMTWIG